ncbi:MAG: aldehyde dehydrogenase [Aeromicrobium sp.]|nr:aldehyde dehydrogenase [Aeromicrobium sp.]
MTIAPAQLDILPDLGAIIDGESVADTSGGTYQHIYAANGEVTSDLPLAGRNDVDRAVAAARCAFPQWRRTTPDRRRDLLLEFARLVRENAQRLAELNVIDNGTPILITSLQTTMTSDLFTYSAGWADKIGGEVVPTWPMPALDYTMEEPYGVVAVIIPWNGPMTAIGQVLAPALAAGNCIVIKPPEVSPYTALELGRMFQEAGFPPGVVNVIPGGPEAGDALVRHPDVDKLHFTGSGATARAIMTAATETLKPLGLELGGKSAIIVFDDADVDSAAAAAVQGITIGLAGQGCINGTRVLVQRAIYDDVVAGAVAALTDLAIGDPADFETTMGPVVTAASCSRILGIIEKASNEGSGRLVAGGTKLEGHLAAGNFIAPTIFADVDPSSSLAQDEVFGPVQSIIPFDTEDEAVAIANGTPFGLAGYIHTQNLGRAHRVSAALDVGNVWVNGGFGIPAAAPFGGNKQSGHGRLGGRHAIAEFTRPKNVWIAL